MLTHPTILAQLQTLWGEPVTESTSEADTEAAFVASELLPSPVAPARLVDSPATWNASTAELINWFQSHRRELPVDPFDLKPGNGVRVVDPALWYRSLDADISTGPTGPRWTLGGLADDLKSLRAVIRG